MKKEMNINNIEEKRFPEWIVENASINPATGSQYDKFPKGVAGFRVDARYIEDKEYDSNIMFRALPPPRTSLQIIKGSVNRIPYESWETEIKKPYDAQYRSIIRLLDWRIALPSQDELEQRINMLFREAYKRRIPFFDKNAAIKVTIDSQEEIVHGKFIKDGHDTGFSGIYIIGKAGSGKTTGIDNATKHYPPMITHYAKGGYRFTHVPYLFVSSPPNSNFKTLYAEIGDELDKRLGNVQPTYRLRFEEARRDLGKCRDILKELIEIFGIGLIIIDEVQNINTGSKNDNSQDSLEFLTNITDVSFVWIGTEQSINKIKTLKTLRRAAGHAIYADRYCGDYTSFKGIMRQLLKYQWFDEPIDPNNEDIIEAFFEYTGGIIEQLVMLYITMNLMALKNRAEQERVPVEQRKKMIVTPEMIKTIALTYYSHIYNAIKTVKYDEQEALLEAKSSEVFNALKREVQLQIAGSVPVNTINDMLVSGVIQEDISDEPVMKEVYGNENEVYSICKHFFGDKYNSETLIKMIEKAYKQLKRRNVPLLTDFLCEEVRKIDAKTTKTDRRPGSKQEIPDNAVLEISDLRENRIDNFSVNT